MATIHLPNDFQELLRLLNAHQVEYLIIGGYAVGYHDALWGVDKGGQV